ncbi:MAG: hypothetical protein OXU61_01800 [Gammaproteobacteria bacterium]|nr:hypothetical protein [Gammaproteobacteria bacterium]
MRNVARSRPSVAAVGVPIWFAAGVPPPLPQIKPDCERTQSAGISPPLPPPPPPPPPPQLAAASASAATTGRLAGCIALRFGRMAGRMA